MPFAFALAASAFLHVAAILGPGWALPGQDESEPSPPLNAVLTPPAETPPTAKPPAKPRPKVIAAKPRPGRPQALPVESTSLAPLPAAATTEAATADIEFAAPTPAAIALPGQGRLRYVITKGASGSGMTVGQSVHTWEHNGLNYMLQSVSETTGIAAIFKPARVVQTSRGVVSGDGLHPLEFRHDRAGGGTDTANFDHDKHTVSFAGREEAAGEDAQDMLSLYYQLVLLAPTAQTLVLELPVTTGRKLERYRFERMGEESIKLADGSDQATVHFGAQSGNDRIEVWIAVGSRTLPVRIRFIDRHGEIFDQLLESAP